MLSLLRCSRSMNGLGLGFHHLGFKEEGTKALGLQEA